jgi:solute carrier family 13 (sodium-dependent dicarboxylate transporter), member 2/3/5
MSEKVVKAKPSGYDKFINWKLFSIPLVLLLLLIIIPTPKSACWMWAWSIPWDSKYAQEFFASGVFQQPVDELEQWQVQMVRMMEKSVQMTSFVQESFLKRNQRWCEQNNIPSTPEHLEQIQRIYPAISS